MEGRGQRWEADHVAGGVDVGHRGLAGAVDGDASPWVRLEARGIEVEPVGIGLPAHRIEQRVALHRLAALEARQHPPARVALDAGDGLAEAEGRALTPHVVRERLDHLLIQEVEDGGPLVDDGHRIAQRGEHGGVLQANHARAHDDHVLAEGVEGEELVGVDDVAAVERDLRAVCGARPAGDEDVLGGHGNAATRRLDDEGVRVGEARGAVDGLDAIALELAADDLGFAVQHGAHPQPELGHQIRSWSV